VFGAPITFSWTVQNTGSDPAVEGWKDQAWLSPDPVFNANAIPLLATPVSPPAGSIPLGAGATYTQTATVNLPLSAALSGGIYYILVKTDALNQQPENNENNNFKSESISVSLPPLPDLVVSSIDAPIEAFSGQNIQYSWTVTNQGTGPATGTWSDRVLLSTDTVVGNDLLLGNFSFTGTIDAGESITRTQTYTLPIAMEGDRWFIVQTDIYNQVFEHANEGNNTRVSDVPMNVQLSPFPNLQVTEVIPPAEAFSSQQAVVQWVVTNTGTGSTSAPVWYDRVWLSTDNVLDGGDTYLGQVANPSYLNPGDSYLNSLTVTLPQGIQGDYWFIVQTDYYNHVYEHNNEHDNVGVGPKTSVTMTPPPDLRVTEITGPDLAFSNQTVTVSWTVLNDDTTPGAGGRTLQTSWYDTVYLSSSPDGLVDTITLGPGLAQRRTEPWRKLHAAPGSDHPGPHRGRLVLLRAHRQRQSRVRAHLQRQQSGSPAGCIGATSTDRYHDDAAGLGSGLRRRAGHRPGQPSAHVHLSSDQLRSGRTPNNSWRTTPTTCRPTPRWTAATFAGQFGSLRCVGCLRCAERSYTRTVTFTLPTVWRATTTCWSIPTRRTSCSRVRRVRRARPTT
jgi:hypothetical protein